MGAALHRAVCGTVVSSAFVFFAGVEASAGAFTLRKGEAKVFVSALVTNGDQYFDRHGKLQTRDRLRKSDIQLFVEYGWSDRLTVFGSIAAQKIAISGEDRASRTGLGRTEIGLRNRLLQSGAWVVSAQSSLVIAGAKPGEGLVAVGEADDQFDSRVLIARSFEAFGRSGFFDLQLGYRARSGDPADEIRFDVTLGMRATPQLLFLLQSFNTFGTTEWLGPYPLLQRIHKVQATALYDLTGPWTLHGAVFATPAARDALDERGAVVGVGYRF